MATEAFSIATEIKYQVGIIRSLNCLGNYYYQQAIYDKAINYYTKALSKSEKNNDIQNIIIGKSNLASLYTRINQTKEALKLLLECDSIYVKNIGSGNQNRAAILTNIGENYSKMKLYQKAIECHFKVLNICKKEKIVFGIAIAETNLGTEYNKLKQYEKAIQHLLIAKKTAEENQYTNLLGLIYKDLGLAYSSRSEFNLAIQYLKQSIHVCIDNNDQNSLFLTNEILYKVYAKANDFKNAYTTSLHFIEIKDSIYSYEKQKIITETNTKYNTEKKESQIKDLHQEKKIATLQSQRQNTLVISLIIGLLLLSCVGYFLFYRFRIKKQNELLKIQLDEAKKTIEAEKRATESELKALKSQMNPHFIFNALNGIQEQFMFGNKEIANEQMGNFTYLTRQILDVSGKKKIPVATEIEILTKYLELEKMRFHKDFEYEINLDENIDDYYTQIPPMLIQPFVENSIKHGLLHREGNKKVSIDFTMNETESAIICTILDNGIGRKKSAEIKALNIIKHESFSTQSINQRLELWNGGAENAVIYEDILNSNNDVMGTKVILTIAIH